MLVLALDTTTRHGSLALTSDDIVADVEIGDPAVPHGVWLPGAFVSLLSRRQLTVGDVDLLAVAAGPGSFTGLRVGIAAMQGLALASGRGIIAVSALEALNAAARELEGCRPAGDADGALVGAWIDAHRGEIFAALYEDRLPVDGPIVADPATTLERWRSFRGQKPIVFIGDGALTYAEAIGRWGASRIISPVPPLAPTIARLAREQFDRQGALAPAAVRPLYVRRPDAELARDRIQDSGSGVQGPGSKVGTKDQKQRPKD